MRNDADIEQLPLRENKQINNILDMFVESQIPIHILRGVEPNLRLGRAIKNYLDINNNLIPKCPNEETNQFLPMNENEYRSSFPSRSKNKCLHLASRKQIGDAIIRFEDKTILKK